MTRLSYLLALGCSIPTLTTAILIGRTDYGSCTANGQAGLCISTSSCSGKSMAGLCPGPVDIQCCTYGTCTANSIKGTCVPTSSCSDGTSTPGLCPGPTNVQCCTYGKCTASGVSGSCQATSSCSGKSTPNLCPGPADIQCCTISSSGGGSSGCGAPDVNSATVSLIKEFEGYRASPYEDPTGHETVGYGHLCTRSGCTEVPYSFPLTAANAVKLLQSDLSTFRKCITADIKVKLNSNQYGALVSWAFNIGCGNVASSSLVKRLNAGESPNTVAKEELPKWNKSSGQTLPGLTRRRAAEVKLFTTSTSTAAIPPKC